MNSLIIVLIFTIFSYSTVQGQYDCVTDNPCELGDYFIPQRGYQCFNLVPNTAYCTCPISNGYEINKPCRLCSRTNPIDNVCNNANPKLVMCLENDDFGTSFACRCDDGIGDKYLTTNANCERFATLSTRPTTTIITASAVVPSSPCVNGGVFVNGGCHCPSGFSGALCRDRNEINSCERIYCKNNGVCAIRNPNGPYEGICLCRYGTSGEYCEINGTLGYCSSGSCLNGGVCKENVVGSTRHAYCHCAAGYNGVKCGNRYFPCPDVGEFPDFTMLNQGKYFKCTSVNGVLRAELKSCAKGFRFNSSAGRCML